MTLFKLHSSAVIGFLVLLFSVPFQTKANVLITLSGTKSISTNTCSQFTASLTSGGNPFNVTTDTKLSMTGVGAGHYYTDNNCTILAGGIVTIFANSSSSDFWFIDATAETTTFNAAFTGYTSGNLTVTTSDTVTLALSGSGSISTNTCTQYTVSQTLGGKPYNAASGESISLTGVGSGFFYTDKNCTMKALGKVTINSGASSANFWFQDGTAETTVFGAAYGSDNSGSLTVTISGANSTNIPTSFFGMIRNSTSSGAFPTVNFGIERYWDTGPAQWAGINTASGVYDWSTLDTMLNDEYNNENSFGNVAFYTLSRTPNWALSSANKSDTTCNFYKAGSSISYQKGGQCYLPSDLNDDGTGTNKIWKDWVTAIANHVNGKDGAKSGCPNGGNYLSCHSYVKYWEIWNEIDRSNILTNDNSNPSFQGTFAQLLRMTEDAKCIIKGTGTIHNWTTNGGGESDLGKSTTCSNKAIDANAKIVMASVHDDTSTSSHPQLDVGQNFLYCNAPIAPKSNSYCTWGGGLDWGAQSVDIINFHNKPGNVITDYNQVEGQMQKYYDDITGMLKANEKNKPLFNGEAGWSGASGNAWQCANCSSALNADEKAAFIARYYLNMWSLGYQTALWYDWDGSNQLAGETKAISAYTQVTNWMTQGVSMTSSCSNVSGTIWTCVFESGTYKAEAIWDTSQNCNNGCSHSTTYNVGTGWKNYLDLDGNKTTMPSSNKPQLGVKPILLQNQ